VKKAQATLLHHVKAGHLADEPRHVQVQINGKSVV
jgi:hypothetical protein